MTFLIKFIRPPSDLAPFESKYAELPVCGRDRDDALDRFDKYLGQRFGYKVIDISVVVYDDFY